MKTGRKLERVRIGREGQCVRKGWNSKCSEAGCSGEWEKSRTVHFLEQHVQEIVWEEGTIVNVWEQDISGEWEHGD